MSGAVQVVKMMIRKTTYPRVEKEVKEEKKKSMCWWLGSMLGKWELPAAEMEASAD